jgi:HAD superfamily hydrolase (TIGR01509 family)
MKKTIAREDAAAPQGVPVDAPDNTAPAISPPAVSRVHRAEDDAAAIARSPDFSDSASVPDDRVSAGQWIPGISTRHRVRAVLLDIDGTLIDSNDAHARAWERAFKEHDVEVDPEVVRRAIGMGGDQLMPQVSGIDERSSLGQQIADRRKQIFWKELVATIKPLPDAARLVKALKARGLIVIAATSAAGDELERLLDIAGVILDGGTSKDDAEQSKPEPDIVHAALARAGVRPDEALMIGDTPYDIEAATKAGVQTIAFRSGGWSDVHLKGALAIYDGPADLLNHLDESPLGNSISDDHRTRTEE